MVNQAKVDIICQLSDLNQLRSMRSPFCHLNSILEYATPQYPVLKTCLLLFLNLFSFIFFQLYHNFFLNVFNVFSSKVDFGDLIPSDFGSVPIVMAGQFRTLVLIPPWVSDRVFVTQYLVLGNWCPVFPIHSMYIYVGWTSGWDSDGLACLICAGLAEGQSGPTYIHHSGHNTYNTIQYNCNTILAILTTLTYTTQQSSENIEDVQISHDIHERLKISFENHSYLAVVLID